MFNKRSKIKQVWVIFKNKFSSENIRSVKKKWI
jgi:hypothetical protein